jgi:excisionase family DNA binding protein
MQAEFISLQDVGDALGVDVQTVRRWIKAGRLRAFKPGKEYRVRKADLEEFLRTRQVRPSEERLAEVREKFRPHAEELERYCRRFESGQEEPKEFFAELAAKGFELGGLYKDEMRDIADALGLVRRAGKQDALGLDDDVIVEAAKAEMQENSLMLAALKRYYALGFALADAVGDEEHAEIMRRMSRTLAGAAA